MFLTLLIMSAGQKCVEVNVMPGINTGMCKEKPWVTLDIILASVTSQIGVSGYTSRTCLCDPRSSGMLRNPDW